jgi:CheY-like chemotaxis protein
MSPARILVVEDDEDTRQLLALALGVRGHTVQEAHSADDALQRLRSGRYDLVVTDYDMPGKTGAAMVKEANALGILDGTSVLMITAHPQPVGADDLQVIRKPLDLDRFLLQIGKILGPDPQETAPASRKKKPAAAAVSSQAPRPLVELALYVTSMSPASARAQRNLSRLLQGYRADQVRFEACDLARHAEQAEKDRVIFTPTLVKRSPEPRTWVLGDLSESGIVVDLLGMSGVETVAG